MCIAIILRFLSSATTHQGFIMSNAFIIHRHVHMCGFIKFCYCKMIKIANYSGTLNSRIQELIVSP